MHKSYEFYKYYILDGMIRQAYNELGMKKHLILRERLERTL